MEIRAVTTRDIEPLLSFAQQMHRESPVYRDMVLDPGKLRDLGERAIREPAKVCVLVARRWGRLVGVLAGFVSETYFGPGTLASDLAVFVPENVRGGMAAVALIKAFEAWARAQGAQSVQLGITTGVAQARTEALYRRLGFEPFGVVCRKKIAGGS